MNILINTTNLRVGGGVQVADSIIRHLPYMEQHKFIVVLCRALKYLSADLNLYNNINVFDYEMPWSILTSITGRDSFLDTLVIENNVDAVLTVFGPSRWRPKVPHLCGFARAQIVIPESPYWRQFSFRSKVKSHIEYYIYKFLFDISSNFLYTENPFITDRVEKLYPKKQVFTITNNYNQIFDNETMWDKSITLPEFNGITFLTVSANYPHKNLHIIRACIEYLKNKHPLLKYRFVLTLTEQQFGTLNALEKEHILLIGQVNINQVPFLYAQSDIMFLPTLLECFSASYAEAMKMKTPILTTDLGFSKSLCGNAACYYSAVSVEDLSNKIFLLSRSAKYCKQLVSEGEKQLLKFDTAKQRTIKLISILEKISNTK